MPRRHPGAGDPMGWLVAILFTLSASWPFPAASELPKQVEQLSLTGWISPLWEPVAAFGGLLDEDDLEEVAIILHRHAELPGDPVLMTGSRALAIFSLDEWGKYERVALSEELLPCVDCLGTLNHDPAANPFDVRIEGRRLTIGWLSNERGLISVRLTFAWNPQEQGYVLVRDEVVHGSRSGEVSSRRIRDYAAGTETLNGVARPIARRTIPIEEVKATDYQ